MKEIIRKLCGREDLTRTEAASAMRTIMDGQATDAQISAFLIGLKLKGERPEEMLGLAQAMRERSNRVTIDDPDAIDMCGTGGDGAGTFNISTVASFVVAGAGVTVAKHGNRSISSSCGSADVLRALGVNIDRSPLEVQTCINEVGIGFLFAPLFHPAMKHAAKPRSELGVKTCFNILGPLTNPAGVRRQLVGAYDPAAARLMSEVFACMDITRIIIVNSHDGLDEVSLESPTTVFDVNGQIFDLHCDFDPKLTGLPVVKRETILGGSADTNAAIAMRVLRGEKGPHRDVVLVNAAFGLLVAGRAHTVEEGVHQASESIDAGRALSKLEDLRLFTTK